MKILITGGSGYIARNIYEYLNEKHNVIALNSKELNLLESDTVYNCIKNGSFDIVIHTATYDPAPRHSTKDPAKVLENNLKMFFNIARCSWYFGKMIYFGSGAEFDRNFWTGHMSEDYFDNYVPADQYGFSKYVMTQYALKSDNIYNLRVFSVFGKYEDWRYRFISHACCRALFDLPIIIKQNAAYDQLYILDLLRIVEWFITHTPRYHTYNVCAGQTWEFKTLAEKVAGISGKDVFVKIEDAQIYREYGGSNDRFMEEFKGFTYTTMDDSIRDLYSWYSDNRGLILRDEL